MKIALLLLKDLKIILKDKKQLAILIFMPIILNTILGFALTESFASNGGVKDTIKVDIVKEYDLNKEITDFITFMSSYSDNQFDDITEFRKTVMDYNMESIFINKFLDSDGISSIIEYEIKTIEEAKLDIENDLVTSYIVLPKGFIYDGLVSMFTPSRNRIEIDVVSTPNSNFYRRIVDEVINGFVNVINLNILNKGIIMETVIANEGWDGFGSMEELLENAFLSGEGQNIRFSDLNITGTKPIDSFTYTSVGLLAMFMLFSAGLAGKTLLDEKMERTYQRTLVTGINTRDVFISKFLLTIIMVLFQALAMIGYSTFILGVQWTNISSLVVIILITSTSIGSLGLLFGFITIISNNYKLVTAFESGIIQVLALLGGTYIPLELLPDPVKIISKFTLNGLFLDSMLTVLSGGMLIDAISNLLLISMFTITFFILAIILLRRKGDQIIL